jgi:spore germination cell wall hydrolase CwlJ-like protein
MITWETWGHHLLALVVWREARGEGYHAQVAVAYSILNRVEKPSWWGRTLAQVIAKKWQYSSMTAPTDPQLIKFPVQPDASFEQVMDVVEAVVTRSVGNPAPHADSYYDTSIPAPKWATDDCFVAQIGTLRFYNVDRDHEPVPGTDSGSV